MSAIVYNNTCKHCQLVFEWIIPVSVCVTCLMKQPNEEFRQPFKPLMWEPEPTAKVNTGIYPCVHYNTSIVVLESVATCEKTAIKCTDCSEILTEPKTDC